MGFESETDDELELPSSEESASQLPSALPTVAHQQPRPEAPHQRGSAPAHQRGPEPATVQGCCTALTASAPLSAQLLDAVITLFNDIQPDFVKQCLDTEAQRQYLLERLDASLKERLQEAIAQGRAEGQASYEGERQKMNDELKRLREMKEQLEKQKEEATAQRLSVDRQRRALTDRVHDLEGQVAQLEADKEQYQLECRSMANKLRAASVSSNDVEELQAQVKQLREDKEQLETMLNERTTRVAQLQAQIAALTMGNRGTELRIEDRGTEERETEDRGTEDRGTEDRETEDRETELRTEGQRIEGQRTEGEKPKKRRRRKKEVSAVDELLDSTYWLKPPEAAPKQKSAATAEPDDFGYKEPTPRKTSSDDDLQLSLF